MLETIQVETSPSPDAAIIWLHGLGADGNDFAGIVDELSLPPSLGIRFVFPHAPIQPVTINGGMPTRAWYDIREMDLSANFDRRGAQTSADLVQELVEQQYAQGISPQRLLLAGFSQGGLIALHLGFRLQSSPAGILALSTYDPTLEELPASLPPIPVFQGHGTWDPVVPLDLALKAKEQMLQRGLTPEFHTYPMPHSVCPEEIADLSFWLSRCLEKA
ncbi:MAG TPA: hypothetical protein VLM37_01115 [Fibrobacteraceae bacterium]|nr:hypothetical protein [Fibrobacteraceae bacterium]